MTRFTFFLLLALGLSFSLTANNIEVTNVTLTNQNNDAATTDILFDLSWENSWRISVGPANYDAAWVFAKYRVNNGDWQHATLVGTPASIPAGAAVDVHDNAGAFVYRATDGNGNVTYDDVTLTWDYGTDDVDPSSVVDVQVFAVEMVYVPEGEFDLGTGPADGDGNGDEANEFNGFVSFFGFPFPSTYRVTSEGTITIGDQIGDLSYGDDNSTNGDLTGPIPAEFPKGFAAFYCMKYEISQAQFVAYFNTLTTAARATLDLTGTPGKNSDTEISRNGIAYEEGGNATTTLPDVACNWISGDILLSYLDWAALRPVTELEYEKAARGPLPARPDEFSWGTATLGSENYVLTNDGQPDERITNAAVGQGNAIYSGTNGDIDGPVRCGLFAASALNANRAETGGSYYGIMELSGNLYERLISVGNPTARAFDGTHGDGSLAFDGTANTPNWPPPTAGYSFRGASWLNNSDFLRVSDRFDGNSAIPSGNNRLGGRGGRTAVSE